MVKILGTSIDNKTSLKQTKSLATTLKSYYKFRYMFLLLIPSFLLVLIFSYFPMYGIIIAFKQFNIYDGILKSPWVGFDNFVRLFSGTNSFSKVFVNTIYISFLRLLFGFPAPIIMAIMLNEVKHSGFKKITQTISYLPHFLSWVILAGLFTLFLSPSYGIVNQIIRLLGGTPVYFLASRTWFVPILIITGIWQGVGWGSIIYLAAISSINTEMYEAAKIDGSNRFQDAIYITIPSILPVMTVMFILSVGGILNAGFDQIFNLYNPAVYGVADIIDTYVYRVGLIDRDFSFSAAVGLFKNVVGLILVFLTNKLSKRFSEYGIW